MCVNLCKPRPHRALQSRDCEASALAVGQPDDLLGRVMRVHPVVVGPCLRRRPAQRDLVLEGLFLHRNRHVPAVDVAVLTLRVPLHSHVELLPPRSGIISKV